MKKNYLLLLLVSVLLLAGCNTAPRRNVRKITINPNPAISRTVVIDEPTAFNATVNLGTVKEGETSEQPQIPDRGMFGKKEENNDLSFEDFDFYYDIMYGGIPEDAYYPSLKYAEGQWKYDLIFRYDSSDGYYYEEIGYADLSLNYDKETVIIELHPKMANDGYEAWALTDADVGYEPFEGGFDENNALKIIGNNAVINPTEYYFSSGREYMIGTIWISEEDFGTFLLTRGQN